MPQCPHCKTHQSPKETCGWCGNPLVVVHEHEPVRALIGTLYDPIPIVECRTCGEILSPEAMA